MTPLSDLPPATLMPTHATTSPPTPTPTLAPAAPAPDLTEALLKFLLDSGFDLRAAAQHFSATHVADLAATPLFQTRLAALIALTNTGIFFRAADARRKSMDELEAALGQTSNPVEKRRAATALLRASAAPLIPSHRAPKGPIPIAPPPTPPTPPRAPKAPPRPAPPPERPPRRREPPPAPAHEPHPKLSPENVASIVTAAVCAPDDPEPNAGLSTISALAADDALIDDAPLDPGDPADPLDVADAIARLARSSLRHAAGTTDAGPSRPPTITPDQAALFRTLRAPTPEGPRTLELTLHLTKSTAQHALNCWLITSLAIAELSVPP